MNPDIIQVIREARNEKGVSLTYMSRKLGYKTTSGYANIEYGLRKLSMDNAIKIFKILEIPMNKLFFEENLLEKGNSKNKLA